MGVHRKLSLLLAGLQLAAACLAPAAAQDVRRLSEGGYSIFNETMADLTYQEVEEAAAQRAVVLWPLGVIEEHGPHLPLGTDIYDSYLEMKQVARLLRAQGRRVVIAPPLYWGINEATASFGGSFTLRPSTLKSLIEDTFFSLRKDGFQVVYIITGHGDRLHNQTIVEAVALARSTTGMRGFVIMDETMKERLGLSGKEPHVLVMDAPTAARNSPPPYLDVHAGAGETSMVWRFFPGLVKVNLIPTLEPTRYGLADLEEWRKGWDNARQKTPLGYFGAPASADPEQGGRAFDERTARLAAAITRHLDNSPFIKQDKKSNDD